ncbi:MAG: ABC transporter substrate-binding protein [Oscillospiraceae bacterium]|jgi:peptide/nickel transport system substrate-binding protein|nr:ABC transporter substrate-binding protein [Oscillospiraceae bacterium]
MKKLAGLTVAAAILALIFAGCGSTAAPGDTAQNNKNEVIIGFTNIPSHFDPLQGFGADGHSGGQLIFSTLVETDADMNIVPDLAASYTVSDDALTYAFELRSDAKFTDGTPVLAGDVVFTYETLRTAATSVDLSLVESVEELGNSVTIKLSKPQSTFILTVAAVGIVPEHAYNSDFGLKPIGSGPFKLTQYDVDQQFILEANPDYYGHAPEINRFIFVKMSDEDTRLAAAKSGQVDITLTSAVLAAVNEIPGYHLLAEDSVDNMGIVMPVVPDEGIINQYGCAVGSNITSDINFRKALAYGLDREAICRDAVNGYATPAYTENDGMPWSNPDSAIEYDLAYAISLLEDSGWVDADGDGIREKNGIKASFPLLYFAGDSVRQAVAMAASQQAKEKLGIEIIVGGSPEDVIHDRMYAEPLILAWGSANPMTSYYLFHSSRAGLDDWYNPENYTSGIVDGYLEQAVNAKSIEEATPFFKKAQWDGSVGTSMRGDAPYIFLINKSHLYWVRDGLDTGKQKIHAHGDAWPLVSNLRDWKWTA